MECFVYGLTTSKQFFSLSSRQAKFLESKIYLFITCAYFPIDQIWGNVVAPSEAVVCCCLIWNGIEKHLKCVWNSHDIKEKKESIFRSRRKHKRENGKTKIESCKKSALFCFFCAIAYFYFVVISSLCFLIPFNLTAAFIRGKTTGMKTDLNELNSLCGWEKNFH